MSLWLCLFLKWLITYLFSLNSVLSLASCSFVNAVLGLFSPLTVLTAPGLLSLLRERRERGPGKKGTIREEKVKQHIVTNVRKWQIGEIVVGIYTVFKSKWQIVNLCSSKTTSPEAFKFSVNVGNK